MNLRREHIIGISVFVLLLITAFAGYQFYYVKQKALCDADVAKLEAYQNAFKHLEETFSGYQPKVMIQAVTDEIQPMAEEVMRRAAFFNTADWGQIDPTPEGKMLRFYYEEQFAKAMNALQEYARAHVPYCPIPENLTFGAQKPEELAGKNIEKGALERNLRLIRYGSMVIRMLIDAKAVIINQVELHKGYPDYEKLLNMRTVGVSFVMNLKDLVLFIDSLRLRDRFFRIDAISIQNRYMRWPTEPPVEVQMLFTQADFNPQAAAVSGGGAGRGGVGPAARAGMAPQTALAQQNMQGRGPKPESFSEKTIRWLRNHFLWPF